MTCVSRVASVAGQAFRKRHSIEKRLESAGLIFKTRELLPLVPLRYPQTGAQRRHLGIVHNARMVILMTGERQTITLDGIGDKTMGLIAR